MQAQFHLPYCIAVGILYDEVTPKYFTEANLTNINVLNLIDKTIVKTNDEYTALFPEKLPSQVKISISTGGQPKEEIISAPWDADNPPSDVMLYQKLISQAGDESTRLWDEMFNS